MKFRTLFPERLHLIKLQLGKVLKSMRGMAYLYTYIKEDQGEELPQEHKKTLKRYIIGKKSEEVTINKNTCKRKRIGNITPNILSNNKERLALKPIQNDQTP